MQIPCEVPEGSGEDTLCGFGGFWCRYLVRFRRFRCRYLRFRKFPVQVLGEVPEGYGADASLGCSEDAW